MADYIINRPTPQGLETLLTAHTYDAVGRIVRLALWAGLMRKELVALQWSDVHPDHLEVEGRQVPLTPALADYFTHCPGQRHAHVVVSSRNQTALSPQSASHMARQALNNAGESAVRLADLRSEYIITSLQTQPWEAVCRDCGLDYTTLRQNFGAYLPEKISLLEQPKQATTLDPAQIQAILDQHTDPSITLAMALAWHMGITLQEMLPLTWQALDLDAGTLTLARGTVPLAPWVRDYLYSIPTQPPQRRLLVGPKSGNPLLPERVSRLVRQVMLRHGIHHVTLRDLVADYHQRQNGSEQILAYLQHQQKATTAQLVQALGLEQGSVYKQLLRLCQQGQVVKVGALYYLPQTVVPPAQHRPTIEAHLALYGRLYRKDAVELLGITPNQASVLLKKWVGEGWLAQEKQSYVAPKG